MKVNVQGYMRIKIGSGSRCEIIFYVLFVGGYYLFPVLLKHPNPPFIVQGEGDITCLSYLQITYQD
jgi:hypothetical protein